jgi:hypothetical protein
MCAPTRVLLANNEGQLQQIRDAIAEWQARVAFISRNGGLCRTWLQTCVATQFAPFHFELDAEGALVMVLRPEQIETWQPVFCLQAVARKLVARMHMVRELQFRQKHPELTQALSEAIDQFHKVIYDARRLLKGHWKKRVRRALRPYAEYSHHIHPSITVARSDKWNVAEWMEEEVHTHRALTAILLGLISSLRAKIAWEAK